MAVNPYDPSQPTGTSQVELSAELRALKGVNVNHRDKIQTLEDQIVPVLDITEHGKNIIDTENADQTLDVLGFGEKMKEIVPLSTSEEILTALGVNSPNAQVISGTNKWTVIFPGGFKINIMFATIEAAGSTVSFLTPFTAQCFAAFATLAENSADVPYVDTLTISGVRVDHDSGGPHDMYILALGV